MTDYKTLEELNLKVGDVVVYRGFEEYKVGPNQTLIFPDGASIKYQGWDTASSFTLKKKDMKNGSIPYGYAVLPDGSTVDLTAITTPFGLLDADTQDALRNHGGPYECWFGRNWVPTPKCDDLKSVPHRVKPQPKVETVTLDSADIRFKGFLKGATITFNLIDGVPDCNSIKMEKLK